MRGIVKGCIHINADGKLAGKGRPRFGNGHAYTPAKTRAAEASLGFEAKVVMLDRKLRPFEGAVKLTIHTFHVRPKSSKKEWPTGKPDFDNVQKTVGDSLNKIVWNDDAQVVQVEYGRYWAAKDRYFIRVEEL